jgi:hypothetical protein
MIWTKAVRAGRQIGSVCACYMKESMHYAFRTIGVRQLDGCMDRMLSPVASGQGCQGRLHRCETNPTLPHWQPCRDCTAFEIRKTNSESAKMADNCGGWGTRGGGETNPTGAVEAVKSAKRTQRGRPKGPESARTNPRHERRDTRTAQTNPRSARWTEWHRSEGSPRRCAAPRAARTGETKRR